MIPLLIISLVEIFAFSHSRFEFNTSSNNVIFALVVFTVTCGIIIIICNLFEKPDQITIDVAKAQDDEVPTYFEQWEDEDPFIAMYLIYGIITLFSLHSIYNVIIKDQSLFHYFKSHIILFLIVDIIIFILMKREIAPNIRSSIAGTIHFETSYMLRAVWLIAFVWGLILFTLITILIGIVLYELIFHSGL